MKQLLQSTSINPQQGAFILSALQYLSSVDGLDDREKQLLSEAQNGLPADEVPAWPASGVDFDDRAAKVLLDLSWLMVLADQRVTEKEQTALMEIAEAIGRGHSEVWSAERRVKVMLLESFKGLTEFREQAVEIGRNLGLSEEDIALALG